MSLTKITFTPSETAWRETMVSESTDDMHTVRPCSCPCIQIKELYFKRCKYQRRPSWGPQKGGGFEQRQEFHRVLSPGVCMWHKSYDLQLHLYTISASAEFRNAFNKPREKSDVQTSSSSSASQNAKCVGMTHRLRWESWLQICVLHTHVQTGMEMLTCLHYQRRDRLSY